MAGKRLDLALIIRADGKTVTAEIKKVSKQVGGLDEQAQKASTSSNRLAGSIKRVGHYAAAYFTAQAIIGFGRAIITSADNMHLLEARTRLATERSGDFANVYGRLYSLSQQNNTAFGETVSLYQNLARTAPELGASTAQILRLTDSVQKLGVISGATQQQQQDSLRQFSQAMAGGVVRAEEFNSIIENTPELANAIAQGLGTSVGQLRLAVVEGKVLSQDVFAALESQAEEIDRKFAQVPKTSAQLAQQVENSFARAAAAIAKATDATGLWQQTLQFTKRTLDDIARAADYGGYINTLGGAAEIHAELARLEQERKRALEDIAQQEIAGITANRTALETVDLKIASLQQELVIREQQAEISGRVTEAERKQLAIKQQLAGLQAAELAQAKSSAELQVQGLKRKQRQRNLTELEQIQLKGQLAVLQDIAALEQQRGAAAEKQAGKEAQRAATRAKAAQEKTRQEAQANVNALAQLERSLLDEEAAIRASYARKREIVAANEQQADPQRLEQLRTRLAEEERIELAALATKEANKLAARELAEQQEQQRLLAKYGREQEAEQLRFELEQEQLLARREAGVISQQQYDLFVEQAEAQHLQRLQAIKDQAAAKELASRNNLDKRMLDAREARQRVEANIAVQEFRFAQQIFGQLLSGAAQHNKQAFEIDKAARIATAAINAHTAASQALAAYPPPFNAAAAAAAYALGLVRVNAIRKQKFGGGSISAAGGATAGVLPAAPPPVAATDTQAVEESEATGPREITIDLHGERYTREQVRELLEQLGEEANIQVQVNSGDDGKAGVAA